MRKKSILKQAVALTLALGISLSGTMISYANLEKMPDGSWKVWYNDESLDEDSVDYTVKYYKWEQQENGRWKCLHTAKGWGIKCDSHQMHMGRKSCPGELYERSLWLSGALVDIEGNTYGFDNDGLMFQDTWVSEYEQLQLGNPNKLTLEENTYYQGILSYFNSDGIMMKSVTLSDGRQLDSNGKWLDSSIIPFTSDGKIDLTIIDRTQSLPLEVSDRIFSDYSLLEVKDSVAKYGDFDLETMQHIATLEWIKPTLKTELAKNKARGIAEFQDITDEMIDNYSGKEMDDLWMLINKHFEY